MNTTLNQYKAIYFDATDTLITLPSPSLILRQYLSSKGIDLEETLVKEVIYDALQKYYVERKRDEAAICSPELDRQYWVWVYAQILVSLGLQRHWTEVELQLIADELYSEFMGPKHYELFDDVKYMLAQLQQHGYRLGIISNFAPTLREILEKHHILHYFERVLISTEIGLEKPNPKIFAYALQEAGLMPNEMLYVGDHSTNDIWAPEQVGIDAVQILRYSHQTGSGIRSLHELL